MKNYLPLGFALVLLSILAPARAADTCPGLILTNASGSPRVVQGNTVKFTWSGLAPAVELWVDGVHRFTYYDFVTPAGTPIFGPGEITLSYGNHTMWVAGDLNGCVVNVTLVEPPPGPPTEAPTLSVSGRRVSWTLVSNATNYELYRDGVFIWRTTGTSVTLPVEACVSHYMTVRACNAYGCGPESYGKWLDGPC